MLSTPNNRAGRSLMNIKLAIKSENGKIAILGVFLRFRRAEIVFKNILALIVRTSIKGATFTVGAHRMARKSLRLKVLRMIRGKNGEHTSNKTDEKLIIHDSELERRIKKWLVESGPPESLVEPNKYQRDHHHPHGARQNATFKPEPQSKGRNLRSSHRSPRQSEGTSGVVTSVLYHPDFADWKNCELAARAPPEKQDELLPENIGTAYLLRVFDDAQASLSMLLSAPFGEPCARPIDPRHTPE
jgi:hypothetical protein